MKAPRAPLVARASRRQVQTRPWQLALAVSGVALGVAVFVAIDLANQSSRRALELSLDALQGRATDEIVAATPGGLDEELFVRLARAGIRPLAPVVEGVARLERTEASVGSSLRILGVDPFSEGPFRPHPAEAATDDERPVRDALLVRPGSCALSRATAARLGTGAGDRLRLRIGGHLAEVEIAAVVGGTANRIDDLLVCDIATAQEVLDLVGRLTRIDLALPADAAGSVRRRALALLPKGALLRPSSARLREGEEMTRAFHLNLTALSLLALVCGAFLIYNTMSFSVVQRRPLIGQLRTLGTTRGEILRTVLAEALLLGAAGSALGLGIGFVLGRGMVSLVSGTINDLYFALSVRDAGASPRTLLLGAALGLGATIAASLAPALEAARTAPRGALLRSLLEAKARRALPRAAGSGAALLALGAVLLRFPSLIAGFAGLFSIIVGFALLAPGGALLLARALRPLLGRTIGATGRIAAGNLEAGLSRTGVAVSALAVAVSVTVGVGTMIESFRGSVERWLARSLRSDLYASPAEPEPGFVGASRPGALADAAARLPDVVRVRPIRRAEVPSPRGSVRLVAVEADPEGVVLRRGDRIDAWSGFARGELLASEPLAARLGLDVGSILPLATARGVRPFRVAGIYLDYASDRGIAMIDRATYRDLWLDSRISGLGVDLARGADLEAAIRRLSALGGDAPLTVRTERELRARSLEVFDRTFRITAVLRWLAGVVAFLGVLSALLALQLERTREIGVLRATGMTPGEVGALVTTECGLLGLAAGLLSLPVGIALAWVLIEVIDRRSFGWSMELMLSPGILGGAVLLALAAALLAGLAPAIRMARISPVEALRGE